MMRAISRQREINTEDYVNAMVGKGLFKERVYILISGNSVYKENKSEYSTSQGERN